VTHAPWRSTTFRLGSLVFLCQILAAAVLLAGLGAVLRGQTNASADHAVATMRDDLLATYGQGGVAALSRAIDLRTTIGGDVVLLQGPSGKPLAGNLPHWPDGIGVSTGFAELELLRVGNDAPEAIRVRVTRLSGGERLLTGVVVESERQVLALLERASLLALILALAMAALVAWLSTRLIVNRLNGTVATLGAVRAGDLARRVPDDSSGDAFAALGTEVNLTLDRIDALMAELTIATDALAHDLKSPLTRLRSSLERAAAVVAEPAAQEAVDRALAEGERLLATVETALRITRAEAGIGRESFAAIDLREMLEMIAEIYAPLAEDHDRAIVVNAPAPATMAVHRELLGQGLGNLIDNSLKYGAGTIALSLAAGPHEVAISVADEGPGIPTERRGEALRRFGRLDEARRGSGAGLGLSLVAATARLHNGTVALGDAGPGLVVTITLPGER
jgi:signal transduction histidine kinase